MRVHFVSVLVPVMVVLVCDIQAATTKAKDAGELAKWAAARREERDAERARKLEALKAKARPVVKPAVTDQPLLKPDAPPMSGAFLCACSAMVFVSHAGVFVLTCGM